MAAAPVQVIQSPEAAAALLSPARLKILEILGEPHSASGVARKLELPRQQVNYHLRELERQGLVELVEERRKGNCMERVVRAVARSYVISPEALGKLGTEPEAVRDRFSAAYLVGVAARAIRELALLGERSTKAKKRLATLTLETQIRFRSAATRNAFAEELASEIARLTAKYHDEQAEGGRPFRLIAGVYPAITKHEPAEAGAVRME